MRLFGRSKLRMLLAGSLFTAVCVLYLTLSLQRRGSYETIAGLKVQVVLPEQSSHVTTQLYSMGTLLRANGRREVQRRNISASWINMAMNAREGVPRRVSADENDPLRQIRRGGERRRMHSQLPADKDLQDPNQRRLLENLSALHKAGEGLREHPVSQTARLKVGQGFSDSHEDMKPGLRNGVKQRSTFLELGAFDAESYLLAQKMEKDEGDPMKRFQFNQVVSDATPPDRYLVDVRNSRCHNSPEQYQNDLPSSSIIICFHNEARSALLRTIVSVLNRSPEDLVEEIILVDDASTDRKQADDGRLLATIPKVRVVRLDERQGLIRARVKGAEEAHGTVLTFLDSHCEVVTGWLEPLLSRIKLNSSRVVCPVIDIINKDDMRYVLASPVVKGGFGVSLSFKWDSMTQREQRARRSPIEPIRTPAIAGGLFAVDKAYFHHIGLYDTAMDIWGGENIELSLRVWMCGGEMEIVPCSHVGHIFRSAMPYNFGPRGTYYNTVLKNVRRTAEVWLDEYKNLYYEKNPNMRNVPYGDTSERLALRERLHCKSFDWYIHNIYPQFEAPPVQDFTYGQLKSRDLCLTLGSAREHDRLSLKPCVLWDAAHQGWALTSKGGIKQERSCLTVVQALNTTLRMTLCKGDISQEFVHLRNGELKHTNTGLCLSASSPLQLASCEPFHLSLHWDYTRATISPDHTHPRY